MATVTHTYDDAKWQLVPKEPTISMFEAGHKDDDGDRIYDTNTIYRAMLSAAPQPPSVEG